MFCVRLTGLTVCFLVPIAVINSNSEKLCAHTVLKLTNTHTLTRYGVSPFQLGNRLLKVTLVYSINYRFRKFYYSPSMQLWKLWKMADKFKISLICGVPHFILYARNMKEKHRFVCITKVQKHFQIWLCAVLSKRSNATHLLLTINFVWSQLNIWKRDDIMMESGSGWIYIIWTLHYSFHFNENRLKRMKIFSSRNILYSI